jgi:hypothetical protein
MLLFALIRVAVDGKGEEEVFEDISVGPGDLVGIGPEAIVEIEHIALIQFPEDSAQLIQFPFYGEFSIQPFGRKLCFDLAESRFEILLYRRIVIGQYGVAGKGLDMGEPGGGILFPFIEVVVFVSGEEGEIDGKADQLFLFLWVQIIKNM